MTEAAEDHSKTLSWPGWAETITNQREFGLELQSPFSEYVLNGRKTIETRAYALPPSLLSDDDSNTQVKINILESEKGQAGVSSIPDRVSLIGSSDASCTHPPLLKRRGWCTFTKSFRYTSREQFEADADKHLVDSTSGYGWNEERPMYGWVVGSCILYASDDDSISNDGIFAERRMRSLFEITKQCQEGNSTILITGASGMLGRALHRLLLNSSPSPSSTSSKKYTTIGTGNTRLQVDHYPDCFPPPNNDDTASKPKPVQLQQLNLLDFQSTTEFVQKYRPDIIVHCAAERYPDAFETKLEESMKLNVESTRHLARECERLAATIGENNTKDNAANNKRDGPYLIYISTSYVFDGGVISKEYPPYHPESKTNPLNNYGRSKLEGERAVFDILNKNPTPTTNAEEGPAAGGRGIVVRVPLLYGEDCCDLSESPALDTMKGFLPKTTAEGAKQTSKKKIDHWAPRFPTSVEDVARVLKLMIDQLLENKFPAVDSPSSGYNTYHIASPHRTTKYELMQLQTKLFNIPASQVAELKGDSSGPPKNSAPRPQCTQLDCSQTWKALGLNDVNEQFEFVTLEDGMKRALNGFPERFVKK